MPGTRRERGGRDAVEVAGVGGEAERDARQPVRQQPDQRRVVGEVGVDALDGPALGLLGADGRGDVDGVPEAGPP